MSDLDAIHNYVQLTDRVGTSGQPQADQFGAIADAGFTTVINLALPSSDHAIANEGSIVTGLGMRYLQIPVDFANPTLSDVRAFIGTMKAFAQEKTWVHCVVNARVSAFMYLYLKHVEELEDDKCRSPILKKWQPRMEKVWTDILDLSAEQIGA